MDITKCSMFNYQCSMNNILITSAGKRVVLVQIFQRTLQEMGLDAKVYTTDIRPGMAPAGSVSDECIPVPRCTADDYIDSLLDICQEKQIGVIIPRIDTELLVLAENHQRFMEQSVRLAVPDKEFIRICCDKRLTKDFFLQAGIDVPKSVDKELIFMEYVNRQEYKEFTVDMYYGLDGCVKGIVPRERIGIRAGEINKGITRKNGIIPFLRQRLGVLKGVRGCICLQLFYRESDGDVKGIEINPRFGGGFPLSYYAKANYVEYLIREYLLGETINYSDAWLDRTLMLRYDNDIIVYDTEE